MHNTYRSYTFWWGGSPRVALVSSPPSQVIHFESRCVEAGSACVLTKAAGADNHEAPVGLQLLAGEDQPVTVLADSAYGSGEFRAELAERGHIDRVNPAPTRSAVPGGFTVDDFTVDHANRTATCTNGLIRPISRTGYVTFGAACATCPLRARCTRSRKGKSLKIRPHDAR